MANLLDIASSGIQAYRKALSVTGQNIANIDTEGYRRREVSLREVSAGQNEITTISDQTGLGVQVKDIARAFDTFLAARSRSASSDFAEADASRTSLEALEATVLPDDYDLSFFLREFFDGLSAIAQSPADLSGRAVAISQGEALAGAFARTSSALSDLKEQVFRQAELAVGEVNALLVGLQNTQRQVVATAAGSGANAILDSRDKALADLSEYVGVTVEDMPGGAARIRLGASGTGPVLGTATEVGALAVTQADGRVIVLAGQNQRLSETQEATSGRLAGLVSAYDTISLTLDRLDALAAQLVRDFNRVHAQGLSLDGKPGGMMFSADSWSIARPPTNLGDFSTSLSAEAMIPTAAEPMTFFFDAARGQWTSTRADGSVVESQKSRITLDGVTVNITGRPANGDSFTLSPSIGQAAHMRFLLTRPEELAAAAMVMATADAANQGRATVGILGSNPIPAPDLPVLTEVTGNNLSALAGVRLRENGVVGIIPAGTQTADLVSLARQEQISFVLNSAQAGATANLTLTLADGPFAGAHTFAWPDNAPLAGDAGSLEAIAHALNTGALKTTGGKTLADLGLYAAGAGTGLTIAAETAALSGGTLGGTAGNVTPRISSASDIQIFTREGVQIAGTPLSQADVIRYLTGANGFLPDAEYRADGLNSGYRGMTVSRVSPTGAASLTLSGAGFAPFQEAGATLPLRSSEARSLTLALGGETSTITVPQGAMAGYIASLVQAQSADTGILASASTRVALSDFADGTVSFQMSGANATPITIRSAVSNGSLRDLAAAINAQSGNTGFSAHLSSDAKRLILVNSGGDDLALSEVTSPGGAFTIGAVDESGAPYPGSQTLGGASGRTAARIGGMVALTSASAFSASFEGQAAVPSRTDAFQQGLMRRTQDPAGSWQEVGFNLTEGLDGNEAGADGLSAALGATELSLDLNGISARIKSATLPDVGTATVAKAMAAALRSQGSLPGMTGVAVDRPANGTTISLQLGRETYRLEMAGGEVKVSGPEAGRLTAFFDSSNRLQVAATGGSLAGAALTLSADTPAGAAAAFGLTAASVRQISGQSFPRPAQDTLYSLDVAYGGVVSRASIRYDHAAGSFTATGLPNGVSLGQIVDASGAIKLQLRAPGNDLTSLRFLGGADATALGLVTADAEVTLTDGGLRFDAVSGDVINLSGSSRSQNGDRLRLSGVPDEDLIVVVTGTGGRMVASALSAPAPLSRPIAPNLSLRVMDATSGRIEIVDQDSGSTIATRYLRPDGLLSAAGYAFRLNGALVTGDRFNIAANLNGTGDSTNITALMALEARNPETGEGGFRERFGAIVTEVGAKTRATKVSANEALARRDAALQQDAEFSGVNLDTEAAKLLEQQQAYQALARVLRTSTELLQSLLDAIS